MESPQWTIFLLAFMEDMSSSFSDNVTYMLKTFSFDYKLLLANVSGLAVQQIAWYLILLPWRPVASVHNSLQCQSWNPSENNNDAVECGWMEMANKERSLLFNV